MSKHETQESAPKKRRWRTIVKYTLLSLFTIGLCGFSFLAGYLLSIEEWKEFDPTEIETSMQRSLVLTDKNGDEYLLLAAEERRRYVSLEQIPLSVRQAFIAIEDARFYEHNGVDFIRIVGALLEDIKSGSIRQGASTISQQLIKTAKLTTDQNLSRKLTEIMMAFRLEQVYSKDEILELYLNLVYFGGGAYGIGTAAEVYFGKDVSELTTAEGALLAGILKSPSRYAPHLNPDLSLERRDLVLSQMEENGFLSSEQCAQAKKEPLRLADHSDEEEYPYGYFTDTVLSEARSILGVSYSDLSRNGYRIETTLDPELQLSLEALTNDPSRFPEDAEDGLPVECAAVVLDVQTGGIAAIQGGREHTARLSFNRATSMRRQPGSAIKPVIVFAPALEYAGYTTTSFLLDEPEDFLGYTPRNSGSTYRGWVTLRDSVAYSINLPAVRLLNEITVARGKSYASSVGIPFEEKDKNLSLALGGFTSGVTPLELCGSYLPFASGGSYQTPSCIRAIYDKEGNLIYENENARYHVLSEETSFLMSSMLCSSVEYGTAKNLAVTGVPLAGKTGTSSYDDAVNNKDAWIVAYNPQYVMCCWMGFDKTDDIHSLPKGVTGGTYPAELASAFFSEIYEKQKAPDFSIPDGIVSVEIDSQVLEEFAEVRLASEDTPEDARITEYYTQDTVPKSSASYLTLTAPSDLSVVADDEGRPLITFTARPQLSYRICRIDAASGKETEIAVIKGKTKVSLTDSSADRDTQYIYRVSPKLPSGALESSPGSTAPNADFLYIPSNTQ